MSDQPLTASAIISFCERLEDDSAAFYNALAEGFPAEANTFAGYAKDCARHKTQVVRTYQETVTDALETGYSFEGLSLDAYAVDLGDVPEDLAAALSKAAELETKAIAFYTDTAEASESLLATIPRAFARVARRRARRQAALEAMQS
jgi:rubrerythrin